MTYFIVLLSTFVDSHHNKNVRTLSYTKNRQRDVLFIKCSKTIENMVQTVKQFFL